MANLRAQEMKNRMFAYLANPNIPRKKFLEQEHAYFDYKGHRNKRLDIYYNKLIGNLPEDPYLGYLKKERLKENNKKIQNSKKRSIAFKSGLLKTTNLSTKGISSSLLSTQQSQLDEEDDEQKRI